MGAEYRTTSGLWSREVVVDGPSRGTLSIVLGFAVMAVGGLAGLLTGNDAVFGVSVLGGFTAIVVGATMYSGDT